MNKPYDFSKVAGIIYKRERPENRWKKEIGLIPRTLAKKFLESVNGILP